MKQAVTSWLQTLAFFYTGIQAFVPHWARCLMWMVTICRCGMEQCYFSARVKVSARECLLPDFQQISWCTGVVQFTCWCSICMIVFWKSVASTAFCVNRQPSCPVSVVTHLNFNFCASCCECHFVVDLWIRGLPVLFSICVCAQWRFVSGMIEMWLGLQAVNSNARHNYFRHNPGSIAACSSFRG